MIKERRRTKGKRGRRFLTNGVVEKKLKWKRGGGQKRGEEGIGDK